MSEHLFNNPRGQRGQAVITIPMHELYELLYNKIIYIQDDFDPEALCQGICVEIEKHQGTFPNLPGAKGASV